MRELLVHDKAVDALEVCLVCFGIASSIQGRGGQRIRRGHRTLLGHGRLRSFPGRFLGSTDASGLDTGFSFQVRLLSSLLLSTPLLQGRLRFCPGSVQEGLQPTCLPPGADGGQCVRDHRGHPVVRQRVEYREGRTMAVVAVHVVGSVCCAGADPQSPCRVVSRVLAET